MSFKRFISLLLFALLIPSARSYGDESREAHDWEQVMSLKPGTTIWLRSQAAPTLTELVVAEVTEDTIVAGVVSEMKESKASQEQILSRCATPSNSRLIVGGEFVDFTRLCRTLSSDEVLEVHARKKKSPLRSVLIGSGVATAIMFAPCGVASQADGAAGGCLVSTAGLGALVGWAIHGLRRGKRVLIYEAEGVEPTWDDLAGEKERFEAAVRKMRKGPSSSGHD
jgi:hypothetical protein